MATVNLYQIRVDPANLTALQKITATIRTDVEVISINRPEQSVETEEAQFRLGNVQATIRGLEEDYFRSSPTGIPAGDPNAPYILEILPDGWVEGKDPIFWGVVQGPTFDQVTRITTLNALSAEYLLKQAPKLSPRSIFEVDAITFGAYTYGEYDGKFFISVPYSTPVEAGDVIQMDLPQGQYMAPALFVTTPSTQNGTRRIVLAMPPSATDAHTGPVTIQSNNLYGLDTVTLTGARAALELLFPPTTENSIGAYADVAGQGWTVDYMSSTGAVLFSAKLSSVYFPSGGADPQIFQDIPNTVVSATTQVRFRLAVDADGFKPGKIRIHDRQMYGYTPPAGDDYYDVETLLVTLLTLGYGNAATPQAGDEEGRPLGIFPWFVSGVDVRPDANGDAIDLGAIWLGTTLSDSPLRAIRELQMVSKSLLRFRPTIVGGLPQLRVEVIPRASLENSPSAEEVSGVIDWTEDAAPRRIDGVVVRPNGDYFKPKGDLDIVGMWFETADGRTPDDLNATEQKYLGLPSGPNVIEIEVPVVPSADETGFLGTYYGGGRILNNSMLRPIAEYYYKWFKSLSRSVTGTLFASDQDLVGKVISVNEGDGDYQVQHSVFITQQEDQLEAKRISFTGYILPNFVPPATTPPTAIIGGSRSYKGEDTTVEILLDGSRSYAPSGGRLSYAWNIQTPTMTVTATGATTSVFIPAGITTVTLTVTDQITGVAAATTTTVSYTVAVETEDGGDPRDYSTEQYVADGVGYVRLYPADTTAVKEVRYRTATGQELQQIDWTATPEPSAWYTGGPLTTADLDVNARGPHFSFSVPLAERALSYVEAYVTYYGDLAPRTVRVAVDADREASFSDASIALTPSGDVYLTATGDDDTQTTNGVKVYGVAKESGQVPPTDGEYVLLGTYNNPMVYQAVYADLAPTQTLYLKVDLINAKDGLVGATRRLAVTNQSFEGQPTADYLVLRGHERVEFASFGDGLIIFDGDADNGTEGLNLRRGGTWARVLDSINYGEVLDARYFTEAEADARFANVSGDTFTGLTTFDAGIKLATHARLTGESGQAVVRSADGSNYASLTVQDLNVIGQINSTNTNVLEVEDTFIKVNRNTVGVPTLNAGLRVERGTSADADMVWDEGLDRWGEKVGTAAFKPFLTGDRAEFIGGAWQFAEDIYFQGSLDVDNAVNANSLYVNTSATVVGATQLDATLAVAGATTLSGALTVGGAAQLNGTLVVAKETTVGQGGQALSLKPGTADHVYIGFFARTATAATRSAFMGFGASASTQFTIKNETGGNIALDTTGQVTLPTKGTTATSAVRADRRINNSASNLGFQITGLGDLTADRTAVLTVPQDLRTTGSPLFSNLYVAGGNIGMRRPSTAGGWARGLEMASIDGSVRDSGIGWLGSGDAMPNQFSIGMDGSWWSTGKGVHVYRSLGGQFRVAIGKLTPGAMLDVAEDMRVYGAANLYSSAYVGNGLTVAAGGVDVTGSAYLRSTTNLIGPAYFSGNATAATWTSGLTGWGITPAGAADFRVITADELIVKAFTADVAQALVGSFILSKSRGVLAEDLVLTGDNVSVSVTFDDLEELPGLAVFEAGDTLRFRVIDRSGGGLVVDDVWGVAESITVNAGGTQTVQVYVLGGQAGLAGRTIYKGSVVLDYGVPGDSLQISTVLDPTSGGYTQGVRWYDDSGDGIPDRYEVDYRLGDLTGLSRTGLTIKSAPGLFTENVYAYKDSTHYFKVDSDGLVLETPNLKISAAGAVEMAGKVTATSGAIANWTINSSQIISTASTAFVALEGQNTGRPLVRMGWDGPNAAGGSYAALSGYNYITLGGATFNVTDRGYGSGWDYTGGGLSINVAGENVFFAGKRTVNSVEKSGAHIAGWEFDATKLQRLVGSVYVAAGASTAAFTGTGFGVGTTSNFVAIRESGDLKQFIWAADTQNEICIGDDTRGVLSGQGMRIRRNNVDVLKADANGLEVTGKIVATSGQFSGYMTAGGWKIGIGAGAGANGIYHNATNYWLDNGVMVTGGPNGYMYSDGSQILIRNATTVFLKVTSAGITFAQDTIINAVNANSTVTISASKLDLAGIATFTSSKAGVSLESLRDQGRIIGFWPLRADAKDVWSGIETPVAANLIRQKDGGAFGLGHTFIGRTYANQTPWLPTVDPSTKFAIGSGASYAVRTAQTPIGERQVWEAEFAATYWTGGTITTGGVGTYWKVLVRSTQGVDVPVTGYIGGGYRSMGTAPASGEWVWLEHFFPFGTDPGGDYPHLNSSGLRIEIAASTLSTYASGPFPQRDVATTSGAAQLKLGASLKGQRKGTFSFWATLGNNGGDSTLWTLNDNAVRNDVWFDSLNRIRWIGPWGSLYAFPNGGGTATAFAQGDEVFVSMTWDMDNPKATIYVYRPSDDSEHYYSTPTSVDLLTFTNPTIGYSGNYSYLQSNSVEQVLITDYAMDRDTEEMIARGGPIREGVARSVIDGDKILTGTIDARSIKAGTITAAEIATDSITADELNVSTLSAISADLGSISAGSIIVREADFNAYGIWINPAQGGSTSTSVAIAAGLADGATYTTAAFRVQYDGKVFASNAEITGKVTATSGAIAGWTIVTGELKSSAGGYTTKLSSSARALTVVEDATGFTPVRVGEAVVSTAAELPTATVVVQTAEVTLDPFTAGGSDNRTYGPISVSGAYAGKPAALRLSVKGDLAGSQMGSQPGYLTVTLKATVSGASQTLGSFQILAPDASTGAHRVIEVPVRLPVGTTALTYELASFSHAPGNESQGDTRKWYVKDMDAKVYERTRTEIGRNGFVVASSPSFSTVITDGEVRIGGDTVRAKSLELPVSKQPAPADYVAAIYSDGTKLYCVLPNGVRKTIKFE